MSLYGDYIKEREGLDIIESWAGFVTYSLHEPGVIWIHDMYVLPHLRRRRVASQLADQVVQIGKNRGATKLRAQVDVTTKIASESTAALRGYGLSADGAKGNLVFFSKEI